MPLPADGTETGPVVIITGASSGFGLVTATHLAARGYRVFGGARRFPDPTKPFATLALDVTNADSVARAVADVVERAGRIDALVNNAGVSFCGSLEHHGIDETRAIIETNTLGVLRMCQAVLPHFRAQRRGRIVNISSLGGRVALPFASLYCASKFAVEGMSEALRYEVRPFGVQVSVLAPGDFLTPMSERYVWTQAAQQDTEYRDTLAHAATIMERDCRAGPPLTLVARAIERILTVRRPRLRYSVGTPFQRAIVALRPCFPEPVFERVVRWLYEP